MVNIISTPCCNTVLVFEMLKQINDEFLLKTGKTRRVCVVNPYPANVENRVSS